mmetsp:Transcript_29330/g.82628  ORF Transcript_29330/g.82628 Transcript_29330/m.82628 type:complete len:90 (-) Transcript_29330:77-346(-)
MPVDRPPQEMLARLSVPRLQELLQAQHAAAESPNRCGTSAAVGSGASWIDFANAMVSIFAVASRQPELPEKAAFYERPPVPEWRKEEEE